MLNRFLRWLGLRPEPKRSVALGFAVVEGRPLPEDLAKRCDLFHSASGGKWRSTLTRDSKSLTDYRAEEFQRVLGRARSLGKRSRHHTAFWPKRRYAPPGVDMRRRSSRSDGFLAHISAFYRSEITAGVTEADVLNEVIALQPEGVEEGECYKALPGHTPISDAELAGYCIAAKRARPKMEIGLNEHSIHRVGMKLSATIAVVNRLNALGAGIRYVGIQGHIDCDEWLADPTSKQQLVSAATRIREETGCIVKLTEVDLRQSQTPGRAGELGQARVAREIAEAALEGRFESITFWDWKDDPENWLIGRDKRQGIVTRIEQIKPCPFDSSGREKPWFSAMARILGW